MLYSIIFLEYFNSVLLPKFLTLGQYDEKVYYLFVFIGIVIIYLLVQPITTWFVTLQSTRLLSYVISSLILLKSLFLIIIFMDGLNHLIFTFLRIGLQCLSVFGVMLIIFHGFRRLIKT